MGSVRVCRGGEGSKSRSSTVVSVESSECGSAETAGSDVIVEVWGTGLERGSGSDGNEKLLGFTSCCSVFLLWNQILNVKQMQPCKWKRGGGVGLRLIEGVRGRYRPAITGLELVSHSGLLSGPTGVGGWIDMHTARGRSGSLGSYRTMRGSVR